MDYDNIGGVSSILRKDAGKIVKNGFQKNKSSHHHHRMMVF